ncbi:hypothetical protein DENSPDRAFT_767134 [Dentipellis sp. KUC8613]|nr:hypothetical protein DENSPDRAFT_767134 [Dentipellis sp. KUC8613]
MSARYAPLPNPHTDPLSTTEMDAAFDDDDEDEDVAIAESRPLTSAPRSPPAPGTYDFENVDYANFPPPGSPPRPSSSALPNDFGNSNGLLPSVDEIPHDAHGPRRSWFRRTAAAVLPHSYVERWGLDYERPAGIVGGGTGNDGVFANVTAKPSRPLQIRQGDEIYLVPEEAQKDVPPSYASAQADAVPPYWETTIHAPSASDTYGEMIIDALPTGSLFSFLWNLLVSVSFQFVGFLLTYLLHTTHAARFGSRAGLGVTLIQYGFALRSRPEGQTDADGWGWRMGMGQPTGDPAEATPTFATAAQAEEYYKGLNITMDHGMPTGMASEPIDNVNFVNDATTDWLSFFLMTIGWFILLTSLLGFWRVKRWERNILASQRENSPPDVNPVTQRRAILSSLQDAFVLPQHMGGMLRAGLGFGHQSQGPDWHEDVAADQREVAAEEGSLRHPDELREREELLAQYAHDPERQAQIRQAFAEDDLLLENMRNAGIL